MSKMLNKLIIILVLSITCVLALILLNNQVDSFGAYKHVFIIGVDGAGAAYSKVSTPNIDRIFDDYAYRYDAKTESITISAQNWGSILTGVSCETHKYNNDSIANNTHTSNNGQLSIFYYAKHAISNANLISIVNWKPINNGIIEDDIGVQKKNTTSDADVLNFALDYLKKDDIPTLMFIYFGESDELAHSHGGFSNEYYNSLVTTDKYIGQIYDTIKNKGILKDSLFILVADHGETTNGHGGNTKEEASAILAVAGYTVNKMILPADTHNRDVAAIALYALGIDKPDHFVSSVPEGLFK